MVLDSELYALISGCDIVMIVGSATLDKLRLNLISKTFHFARVRWAGSVCGVEHSGYLSGRRAAPSISAFQNETGRRAEAGRGRGAPPVFRAVVVHGAGGRASGANRGLGSGGARGNDRRCLPGATGESWWHNFMPSEIVSALTAQRPLNESSQWKSGWSPGRRLSTPDPDCMILRRAGGSLDASQRSRSVWFCVSSKGSGLGGHSCSEA